MHHMIGLITAIKSVTPEEKPRSCLTYLPYFIRHSRSEDALVVLDVPILLERKKTLKALEMKELQ
jgi:hypothetical protein